MRSTHEEAARSWRTRDGDSGASEMSGGLEFDAFWKLLGLRSSGLDPVLSSCVVMTVGHECLQYRTAQNK